MFIRNNLFNNKFTVIVLLPLYCSAMEQTQPVSRVSSLKDLCLNQVAPYIEQSFYKKNGKETDWNNKETQEHAYAIVRELPIELMERLKNTIIERIDLCRLYKISPDHRYAVMGPPNSLTQELYDVIHKEDLRETDENYTYGVFSPDNTYLVTRESLEHNDFIAVTALESNETKTVKIPGLWGPYFFYDKKTLIVNTLSKIFLLDLKTMQFCKELECKKLDTQYGASLPPYVIFAKFGKENPKNSKKYPGIIYCWDVISTTPNVISKTFEGHTDGIVSLAVDQVSQHIISGSYDKTARVWDLNAPQDKACVAILKHTETLGRICSVCLNPGATQALTGTTLWLTGSRIYWWDVKAQECLREIATSNSFIDDPFVSWAITNKSIIIKIGATAYQTTPTALMRHFFQSTLVSIAQKVLEDNQKELEKETQKN